MPVVQVVILEMVDKMPYGEAEIDSDATLTVNGVNYVCKVEQIVASQAKLTSLPDFSANITATNVTEVP